MGTGGAALRLSLIGGFALRYGNDTVGVSPAGQRLVALLAINDRPLPRPHVADRLWVDVPEQRAAASLRSTLWRLPQPGGIPLVAATTTCVALNERVCVDYREITAVAAAVRQSDGSGAEVSPEVFTQDLLPCWYDDWVLVERERFRQLRLHALESLAARLVGVGQFGDAIQAALAAVAGEPLRESAHRQLVRAYLAEGNLGEALRQFRWCRQLFATELGVEPSPELRRLVVHLLR